MTVALLGPIGSGGTANASLGDGATRFSSVRNVHCARHRAHRAIHNFRCSFCLQAALAARPSFVFADGPSLECRRKGISEAAQAARLRFQLVRGAASGVQAAAWVEIEGIAAGNAVCRGYLQKAVASLTVLLYATMPLTLSIVLRLRQCR